MCLFSLGIYEIREAARRSFQLVYRVPKCNLYSSNSVSINFFHIVCDIIELDFLDSPRRPRSAEIRSLARTFFPPPQQRRHSFGFQPPSWRLLICNSCMQLCVVQPHEAIPTQSECICLSTSDSVSSAPTVTCIVETCGIYCLDPPISLDSVIHVRRSAVAHTPGTTDAKRKTKT